MEGDGRGRTPSLRMWRRGVALLLIPALHWQAAAGATAAGGWPSRTDPEYGWAIAWDPTLWAEAAPVVGQTADFALGSAERGSVVSFLATEAYAGTPDVCVAAAPGVIARSVPDAAAAAPLEPMRDAVGEQMVGRETDGAYAVYAVADGAREVVWTVRCRTLTIGRAELLVVHTVDRADYEAEAVRVAALLAGLALPLDAGPRPTPPFACRTLIPGEAVLLITHRVGLAEYAAEAARVADLLTGLEVSGEGAVGWVDRAIA